MNVTDQYAWWRAALAGTFAPIQADEPQAGFYETRSKNRATGVETRGIVAYWYRDGELRCKNGTGMLDDLRARERWPYASKRPIAKETYDSVRAGKGWPDEHPAAAADRANNAPDADSFEDLADRIEDLAREAETLIAGGAAKDKEAADQAADLADRLLAREKLADSKRAAEKKVHDEASKAVQKRWMPLVTRAADAKTRLKRLVLTPFLVTANKDAAPKTTVGTTATVSLRTVTTAVIEDYPRVLTYFASNEKVRELVQQLANAAVRAGTTPDGCRVHTEQAAA